MTYWEWFRQDLYWRMVIGLPLTLIILLVVSILLHREARKK